MTVLNSTFRYRVLIQKHFPGLHDQRSHGRRGPGVLKKVGTKAFIQHFEAAFDGSKYTHHVSHYTPQDAKGMQFYTSHGGKTGFGVKDHHDGRIEITALFNESGIENEGARALMAGVKQHGGNYVECYGPYLNELYAELGFEVMSQDPFAPEYAAKGWDYKKFDHPPYYTMRLKGSDVVKAVTPELSEPDYALIWAMVCDRVEAEMDPEEYRLYGAAMQAAAEKQL